MTSCKNRHIYKIMRSLLKIIILLSFSSTGQNNIKKMLKWVFCVTLLYITDFVVCKPDYKYNEDVNGWLKFHTIPRTWEDAFLQCYYEGAVLASPLNADFVSVISDIMSDEDASDIFIGSSAVFSEGDYISVEGVPLIDMPVKWMERFDNKKPENCLSYYDKKVNPISCSTYLPYICYKKKDRFARLNGCGTFDYKYRLNKATGNERCYKFHSEFRTWSEAHRICLAEGGHLAIIDDQAANIIKNLFPPNYSVAFIGLRKWKHDTWLTVHGQPLEVYHNWNTKDISKTQSSYGVLFSNGSLGESVDTSTELTFICEKDPYTSRFQRVPDENHHSELLH
nr:secretory phospholipase A2 receptor-like [Helicoverpa armigera]